MSTTAARCPACNGTNLHVAEWFDNDGDVTYYMVCDDCGYEDPDKFEEEYVAIDHWNRRVVTGYVDGVDPTDTEYDQLDEGDWSVIPETGNSPKGNISWGIPERKVPLSRSSYREFRNRKRDAGDEE